jgi:hypothetical protein
MLAGCQGDQSGVPVGAEREAEGEGRITEPHGDRVVAKPGDPAQVGDPEGRVVGDALERHVQQPADRRACPVRADAPACPDPGQPLGALHKHHDATVGPVGAVDEVDEPVQRAHLVAGFGERRPQQFLVAALLEDVDARVAGGPLLCRVDADLLRVGVLADLHPSDTVRVGEHRCDDPQLVVDLHGSGLHG